MAMVARHKRTPDLVDTSIDEIAQRYVARYASRKPDWAAFTDAKIEGYKRAQHRFIGNTSGKPDSNIIPSVAFTLSIMYVPPGQGNASHTHEVEEVFFVLRGSLIVFFEDESGKHIEVALGAWDCVSCPAGVIHGYRNDSAEPVFLQVMVGKGRPELMGYADADLYARRDEHTKIA